MSIYDDLANSDFVDKGRFKAQLRQLGHDPDQDHDYSEEESRADDVQGSQGMNTLKRGHLENPMDQINEQSIKPRLIGHQVEDRRNEPFEPAENGHVLTFEDQIKQAHLQRNRFEQ